MSMKRRLSALILTVATASIALTGCGKEENPNEFKVGMEAAYAPFNWTQQDNSNGAAKIEGSDQYANGYDVQVAQKIAKALGKELVIVKTEWDGLVPSINSGKADAILAGMSPTKERKEAIDFSENYYNSDLVLVVKKGGKYDGATSLKDFTGAKVTAQANTFHYTVIDQIPGVAKQTQMGDFGAMRVALESGVIDAYVSERPEGVSAQSANSNFKMIELKEGFKTSEEDTAVAVGLKKGDTNKAKIDEAIKAISKEERTKMMDEAIKNQPAAQ